MKIITKDRWLKKLALAGMLVTAAALCSLKTYAQNKLMWNFNVPVIENVDSVLLKIINAGNKEIFKDSIALHGSRNDIPTENPLL